jgi:hypothetical protein
MFWHSIKELFILFSEYHGYSKLAIQKTDIKFNHQKYALIQNKAKVVIRYLI